MPARQFVVSGFGHYRPLQPNTSEDNRRQNRRVEIILSKETAPVPATAPTP
jgi:chemotaxis protein MotB